MPMLYGVVRNPTEMSGEAIPNTAELECELRSLESKTTLVIYIRYIKASFIPSLVTIQKVPSLHLREVIISFASRWAALQLCPTHSIEASHFLIRLDEQERQRTKELQRRLYRK